MKFEIITVCVLTHDEILKKIDSGEIKIEPFNPESVGPASVDLRVGNTFRVFKPLQELYHIQTKVDVNEISELIKVKDFLTLKPGESVHGITMETVTLPPDICGWIEGRSRFARVGLMIHITASFIQPGVSAKQVLEMINVGSIPLAIHPGTPICQFIFEQCRGKAYYQGIFHKQIEP